MLATDVFLERDDVREALRCRDFGTLFRLLNRLRGVSQTQIAATTGLTQGRVSRVMSGSKDRLVHIDVIERIADGLRIPGHLLGLATRPWEEDDEDDRSTADTALAGLCYLAIYGGDPREVLRLLDPRLGTGIKQATPPLAWLWAFQGRAHAALRQHADTDRAFTHAHELLERSPSTQVTAGIFSFLPEGLAFYQANAYVALGATEQARAAADQALRLYDLSETTEPALVRFERASALAQAGELDEASRYAVATVLDPRTYPSITVRTRANVFGDLLDQIAGPETPAVREWHEVTANVYQPLPPLRGATSRKELSWATPNETT